MEKPLEAGESQVLRDSVQADAPKNEGARGASSQIVDFIPYLIDDNSGVGTQVVAGDVNGDGLADIVVGNKKGTFVHLHEKKTVSREEWEKAQPKPFVATSAAVK